MLWIALLLVGAAIAGAYFYGTSRMSATYISFKCRSCKSDINVAKAETVRRVNQAKADGTVGELGQRKIPCPRCGTDQSADWLMHPGTQQILRELEAHFVRKETAQEFVSAMYDDGAGKKDPLQPPGGRDRT
jgi:uncharacterized protein (UPF0212 family)